VPESSFSSLLEDPPLIPEPDLSVTTSQPLVLVPALSFSLRSSLLFPAPTHFRRRARPCQPSLYSMLNHRTIKWFGLEGTLKITWFQPPAMGRDTFHQTRLLRAPSNPALNTAREGAATASVGNLFQCFTTLMVKNFFLISNLDLPSFSLEPFPLVLSLHTLVKRVNKPNSLTFLRGLPLCRRLPRQPTWGCTAVRGIQPGGVGGALCPPPSTAARSLGPGAGGAAARPARRPLAARPAVSQVRAARRAKGNSARVSLLTGKKKNPQINRERCSGAFPAPASPRTAAGPGRAGPGRGRSGGRRK